MLEKIKINSEMTESIINFVNKNYIKKELKFMDIEISKILKSYMHSFLFADQDIRNFFSDIQNKTIKKNYNFDSKSKKLVISDFVKRNKIDVNLKSKIYSRENKYSLIRLKKYFFKKKEKSKIKLPEKSNFYLIPIYNFHQLKFFENLFYKTKINYKFFDFYDFFLRNNYKIRKNKFVNNNSPFKFISKDIDINYIQNCIIYAEKMILELKPRAIFFSEGDNFIDQIFGAVAKKNRIPTICFQWGSLINHPLKISYRNFTYDHYFSWGPFFSQKLGVYNKKTKFHNVGNILSSQKQNKKKKIIFFLQCVAEPNLDKSNNDQLNELIIWTAKNTNIEIIVRSHPSFYPKTEFFKKIQIYPNIKFHNSNKISFCKSMEDVMIAISINSSSLIEALIFDVLPFYFITNSKQKEFNHDLLKYKNILQFDHLKDIKKAIDYYLRNKNIEKKRSIIKRFKKNFIINNGEKAKREMLNKIEEIALN